MKRTERVIHCCYKLHRILLQSGAEEMWRELIETSVGILINFGTQKVGLYLNIIHYISGER